MKGKKHVLITIIVLLCVFIPLTVIGFLNREVTDIEEENANHNFSYNGYLWFYDSEGTLLSKYECQTETCEYTTTSIDDEDYGINYYKDGENFTTSLINDKYAFITDGSAIYLYSAATGGTLQTYKAVKNYGTSLVEGIYIVQNTDDLWGAVIVDDILRTVIPFEYDFIGLISDLDGDDNLKTDKFIVLKDDKWVIVDASNEAVSGYMDYPIVDYTNNYIFSYTDDKYKIYSYENDEYLSNYTIRNYIVAGDYIGIITESFLLIYSNLEDSYLKSIALSSIEGKISLEVVGNVLNIMADEIVIDTLALN